jgi:hypothetical protein
MHNDSSTEKSEPEHIDTILAAMKTADSEEERRQFARAAARWFDLQIASLGDRMSAFVAGLTVTP